MLNRLTRAVKTAVRRRVHECGRTITHMLRPVRTGAALVCAVSIDAVRPRSALVAENALLRQQILVLRRAAPSRPRLHAEDRLILVFLARLHTAWRDALHVVKPDTLLRWHRDLFTLLWHHKSRRRGARGRLRVELIDLIQAMATANGLWGAERIRGELLKLGIRVSKRTVQQYMRSVRPRGQHGQTWGTFLRKPHARHLGLRCPAALRRRVPPDLRVLYRRPRDPRGRQRHPLPYRCVGRSAAPRGYAVRQRTAVLDPGQRWQVRPRLRRGRHKRGY